MTKTTYQPAEGYVIPANGIEVVNDGADMLIKYDIAQAATEEEQPKQYTANEVRVKRSATYGDIVSAIIDDKYSNDAMQAIINNHLLDSTSEHEAEFNEMQAWRSHAKEVAHKVVG